MLILVASTPSPFFLFQKLFMVLYLDLYLVKFFFLVRLLMLPFIPLITNICATFLVKEAQKKVKKPTTKTFTFTVYLKIYWFCLPASVPLMALLSHLFFLCFCLSSIQFPPPPAPLFPVLFPPLICYSYWSRSRIHERTISLRFLGIIFRVLRFEFSVWIFKTKGKGYGFFIRFSSFLLYSVPRETVRGCVSLKK
jgi:hypothetical protein